MKSLKNINRFNVPVVLIAYNRPETVKQVFTAIREIAPSQLFIITDGPNHERQNDEKNCLQVREILSQVDWACEVKRNYAETNLGCGYRIPSGLDWVFEIVEEAIILEDDCLPHPSFFTFCEAMLAEYRHQQDVTQICGTNRLYSWKLEQQSYHFARYSSAWGWATWKRAWQQYHHHSELWQDPQIREKIKNLIGNPEQFDYFCRRYLLTQQQPKMTWDYQWSLVQLARGGRSIIPAINLIKNLGFNNSATHTHTFSIARFFQASRALEFPFKPPLSNNYDDEYDRKHFAWSIGKPEPDSVMVIINQLMAQSHYVHALVILQSAIREYPENLDFISERQQLLRKMGKLSDH